MIQQANHAWIGWLLGLGIVLIFLLGVSLSTTDLLNWNTQSAKADATRTAVAENSANLAANRIGSATAAAISAHASATHAAIDAANNEVMAHATQTDIAESSADRMMNRMSTATASAANAQAIATRAAFDAANYAALVRATQTAVAIGPTQTAAAVSFQNHLAEEEHRRNSEILTSSAPIAMFLLAAVLLIAAITAGCCIVLSERSRTAQAEAQRYESQAKVLREQRRNAELAASLTLVPEYYERALKSTTVTSGNGNGRESVIHDSDGINRTYR